MTKRPPGRRGGGGRGPKVRGGGSRGSKDKGCMLLLIVGSALMLMSLSGGFGLVLAVVTK